MGKRGNKPLKKNEEIATPTTLYCLCCGKSYDTETFYDSDSELHKATGKVPYCKDCIEYFYDKYLNKYKREGYLNPERKALEKLCMVLDIYYKDSIYDKHVKEFIGKVNATPFSLYIKQIKLYQYRNKNYDTTIHDKYISNKNEDLAISMYSKEDKNQGEDIESATRIFGNGFSNDDYLYLYREYIDWTTRHECETKTQEEIFKRICFKQLEIHNATKRGEDTKDLDASLLKLLEAAKLQPKQNHGETISDAQTLGTLIDKWETTRPLPEIDESLQDVDRIGLYIDVFFKGHLAKMMGLKNGISNLYTKFMKKYTVEKPEYNDNEDGSALFDAIFGNGSLD